MGRLMKLFHNVLAKQAPLRWATTTKKRLTSFAKKLSNHAFSLPSLSLSLFPLPYSTLHLLKLKNKKGKKKKKKRKKKKKKKKRKKRKKKKKKKKSKKSKRKNVSFALKYAPCQVFNIDFLDVNAKNWWLAMIACTIPYTISVPNALFATSKYLICLTNPTCTWIVKYALSTTSKY